MKLKIRRPTPVGLDNILNKRLSGIMGIANPPSTQKSQRGLRSNLSLHISSSAKIKTDFSSCGIPKPTRHSFRMSDTRSQVISSSKDVDKYTVLKNDFESMKDELAKRNTTILNLQKEIKEIKSKFMAEKTSLLAKIQDNTQSDQMYAEFQQKLDKIIAENEQFAKLIQVCI